MKYVKSDILSTSKKLSNASSDLNSIRNRLYSISPNNCTNTFYSKRYNIVRNIDSIQSDIESLSNDIANAANRMSNDDVQNANQLRSVFKNRAIGLYSGYLAFGLNRIELNKSSTIPTYLQYSRANMNMSSIQNLGAKNTSDIPWYQKVWNGVKSGAQSLGKAVGDFGSSVYNGGKEFFKSAGQWIGDRATDVGNFFKGAGEYTWKSIKKFILGDYDDENITVLSFLGNLVTSFFDFDLPLDLRDLVYDIQHWGEGDYFGVWFAVDCIALLPVVGMLKNLKYADDIADGAKNLGRVIDTAGDIGKYSDDIHDIAKNADRAADAIDDIHDTAKNADNISDAAKNIDTVHDGVKQVSKLTSDNIKQIKCEMGWSDEIIDGIKDMDQYKLYKDANLTEAMIDGRKCLIKEIDPNYIDKTTGLTNLELMKAGNAPIDWRTGEKIELHHMGQEFDGAFAELAKTSEHGDGKHAILHDITITSWRKESPELVNVYNSQRYHHWRERYKYYAALSGK